jgi:hypothetical protein
MKLVRGLVGIDAHGLLFEILGTLAGPTIVATSSTPAATTATPAPAARAAFRVVTPTFFAAPLFVAAALLARRPIEFIHNLGVDHTAAWTFVRVDDVINGQRLFATWLFVT